LISEQFAQLRSGRPEQILAVLSRGPLDPLLAPQVIQLLSWEEVYSHGLRSLREIAPLITGLLTDALLDQKVDPVIRCALPRVLCAASSQIAVDGLLASLTDPLFEVRFQSGRALARLQESYPDVRIPAETIYDCLEKDWEGDGLLWDSLRPTKEQENSFLVQGLNLERVDWRLEHTFTLLSLVFSKQPLSIAFRGLHSEERDIRGTALEYLSSILPGPTRAQLLPFLEENASPF
jgi:hypothetical protein